jgi:hypothetical protein
MLAGASDTIGRWFELSKTAIQRDGSGRYLLCQYEQLSHDDIVQGGVLCRLSESPVDLADKFSSLVNITRNLLRRQSAVCKYTLYDHSQPVHFYINSPIKYIA